MKNQYYNYLILIVSFVLFNLLSCQKRTISQSNTLYEEISESVEFIKVNDSRLHFSSKDVLVYKIEEFKKKGAEFAAKELAKLYEKGFYSLRPIINTSNEKEIEQYLDRLNERKSSIYFTESESEDFLNAFEYLIADDEVASLINDKGEIQIKDSIYVYTGRGLYFVHESDVEYLYNYLNKKLDDDNNSFRRFSSSSLIDDAYGYFRGIKKIDERINFFRPRSIYPFKERIYPLIAPSPVTYQTKLRNNLIWRRNQGLKNLSVCSSSRRGLNAIFGDAKICTDYFETKRRAKNKFWHQNYLFYQGIGIKVKNQKKGWTGIWRAVPADEIGVGINQIYFKYTIPIKRPNFQQNNVPFFVVDGQAYDSYGDYLSDNTIPEYPVLPEKYKDIFQIVVQTPIRSYDFTPEDAYKLFWQQLANYVPTLLRKLNKPSPTKVAMVAYTGSYYPEITGETIIVHIVDFEEFRQNTKKIVKTFDQQFSIKGSSKGGKLDNIGPGDVFEYEDIHIDYYGGVRRGNTWKGHRLVFD